MRLNLEKLSELVRTVAHEHRIDAEIIGVTPSEGDGAYSEVILDCSGVDLESQRISIGVARDAEPDDLRRQVAQRLDTLCAGRS
jgi:hypothetical protein